MICKCTKFWLQHSRLHQKVSKAFCSIVDHFIMWIKSFRCFFLDAFLDSIDHEISNFYLHNYIGSKKIFDGYQFFILCLTSSTIITLKTSPAVARKQSLSYIYFPTKWALNYWQVLAIFFTRFPSKLTISTCRIDIKKDHYCGEFWWLFI